MTIYREEAFEATAWKNQNASQVDLLMIILNVVTFRERLWFDRVYSAIDRNQKGEITEIGQPTQPIYLLPMTTNSWHTFINPLTNIPLHPTFGTRNPPRITYPYSSSSST